MNYFFLQWSHSLAEESTKVRSNEVAKREAFRSFLSELSFFAIVNNCHLYFISEHHFLQALFPGFNDVPPDFAVTKI
jgi:hypothetical protein